MSLKDTLLKFNFPQSLVREYQNWYLLLRPNQVTLGAFILITKNGETSYSNISSEGFKEFPKIINEVETILKLDLHCQKINYLMLMMTDPEVHYHIIPRYSTDKRFKGLAVDVLSGENGSHKLNMIRELSKSKNIIITPHIAGATYESMSRTEEFIATKVIKRIQNDG